LLKIGGVDAKPAQEQRLPHGGSVGPIENGYQVKWPDGTKLLVLPVGQYGLNAVIEPASSRKDTLHGLLGPFQGVRENPAMEDRSGKRYDSVTTTDQLYKEIGESWRITQAGTQFDYASGQSTATFTRRDMPAKVIQAKDLTAAQRQKGEAACKSIDDLTLREQCVFDFGLTEDKAFADSYVRLQAVRHDDTPAGQTKVDIKEGPIHLQLGETKTFTVPADPATDLFLSEDFGSLDPSDVKRVLSGPQYEMSTFYGKGPYTTRLHATTSGTFTMKVSVADGGTAPGSYSFRAVTAGPLRNFDVTLPADVGSSHPAGTGGLHGPGAQDDIHFEGKPGDKIIVSSATPCVFQPPVELQLVSSDPNDTIRILNICKYEFEREILENGTYTISLRNATADATTVDYGLTIKRKS
jgi:hypothetical protein